MNDKQPPAPTLPPTSDLVPRSAEVFSPDHVSFANDDSADGNPRLHVSFGGNMDYYVEVHDSPRPQIAPSFRACTSGARDEAVTSLVAALFHYGQGRASQAASCARNFSSQVEGAPVDSRDDDIVWEPSGHPSSWRATWRSRHHDLQLEVAYRTHLRWEWSVRILHDLGDAPLLASGEWDGQDDLDHLTATQELCADVARAQHRQLEASYKRDGMEAQP